MRLTITTLVIVEGSYIQGIYHSLEEHPGKAYQELTANGFKTAILKEL
jgi:hypothetical protein